MLRSIDTLINARVQVNDPIVDFPRTPKAVSAMTGILLQSFLFSRVR